MTYRIYRGYTLYHVDITTSTMDIARTINNHYIPAIISTNQQTHGRGRNNKSFEAPYGHSLLMTLVHNNKDIISPNYIWGMHCALYICYMLEQHYKLNAYIKWPNDIIIAHHKLAGLLHECTAHYTYSGIGLNILQKDFSPQLQSRTLSPISLAQLYTLHPQVTPQYILQQLLDTMLDYPIHDWHTQCNKRLYGRNTPCIVTENNTSWNAHIIEIHTSGALLVDNGKKQILLHSADIHYL